MSVDINWDTLTGGPDGEALAETIRHFLHDRFQAIALPKLIRSVAVHSFDFGSVAPEIVLKDIGDPLPDFYDTDEDDSESDGESDGLNNKKDGNVTRDEESVPPLTANRPVRDQQRMNWQSHANHLPASTSLGRGTTPGVLGTTSNLGYFHLPLSAGLPGTQTPLAAVASAHFTGGRAPLESQRNHAESFDSGSPPLSATPVSSQDHNYHDGTAASLHGNDFDPGSMDKKQDHPDRSPEDLQVVFHVTYSGNVQLSLTADVFLDYPMPSFVGIPLKLRITGLTFNGVGILAYIKKRAHLCFLNPEDAVALVGSEPSINDPTADSPFPDGGSRPSKVGALLEDIKIESEMGETDSGRQVLKNVGKIEKFILEQVQQIFEDEFVYPSFWTFLV